MKEQLLLASFGTCLGGLLLGAVYLVAVEFSLLPGFLTPTAATHFDSVADFQRTMLDQDEQDAKIDESVSLRSIITPHQNELIMYDLQPNKAVKFQGVPVRLNSCGMRGSEVSPEVPEKTIRIAFLGDSFTFGWGVEEQRSFVEVTGEVLNRHLALQDTRVEMLNFGTPGYSTFQEVELFLKEDIEFQPDIVVVFFIQNDFGLPFFIRDFGGSGEVVTSSAFEKKANGTKDEAVRAERAKVVGRLDPNKALRRLARRSHKEGFQLFVAFNPHPKWRENLKRLWFVRKTRLLETIPLRTRFLEAMAAFGIKESELSLAHDPHPSSVKHSILGGLLAESLLPEVSRLAAVKENSDV